VFDSIGMFAKQFTPVDGGYLYYSSRKSGGKLVTAEEYEGLLEGWRKVAGGAGTLKSVGVVILWILLSTLISKSLELPGWADKILIAVAVVGISAWLLWAGFAPYRLVRDREAVTPPRPGSEARKQARAALNWPMVIVFLLASGATFFASIALPREMVASWAWLVGSGLMFVAYAWVAIQKPRDG